MNMPRLGTHHKGCNKLIVKGFCDDVEDAENSKWRTAVSILYTV